MSPASVSPAGAALARSSRDRASRASRLLGERSRTTDQRERASNERPSTSARRAISAEWRTASALGLVTRIS